MSIHWACREIDVVRDTALREELSPVRRVIGTVNRPIIAAAEHRAPSVTVPKFGVSKSALCSAPVPAIIKHRRVKQGNSADGKDALPRDRPLAGDDIECDPVASTKVSVAYS